MNSTGICSSSSLSSAVGCAYRSNGLFFLLVIEAATICFEASPCPTFLSRGGALSTIIAPILHHLSPLLEQIAATICGLNTVGDGVRECLFYDVIRISGCLCRPIAERAAETVHCRAATHAVEHLP